MVNAALMAGENVTERHRAPRVLGGARRRRARRPSRLAALGSGSVRRQVTEITAVLPNLGDEQTFEPIFVRDGSGPFRSNGPVRSLPRSKRGSTGHSRPACASARSSTDRRRSREDRRRARASGWRAHCSPRRCSEPCRARRPRPGSMDRLTARRLRADVWLQQADVGVGLVRFVFGSAAAGPARAPRRVDAHGIGVRGRGARRRGRARCRARTSAGDDASGMREVQAAWPDGLRDLVASIAAGHSLTQAVTNLSVTGPPAMRVAFARFPQLARVLGTGGALQLIEEELADPTSDRVLEVLILAQERGARSCATSSTTSSTRRRVISSCSTRSRRKVSRCGSTPRPSWCSRGSCWWR